MSQTSVSQFRFRIRSGSPLSKTHDLENGRSVFIGGGDSCGIQLQGSGIAEIHCLVDVDDDGVSVQDWASDSGTLVNGTRVEDKTRLKPGDSVQIGSVEAILEGEAKPSIKESELPQGPPRQASIGMESLGLEPENEVEEDEVEPQAESPAVVNVPNVPIVSVPAGRLSDSFGAAPEAVDSNDEILQEVEPAFLAERIQETDDVPDSLPQLIADEDTPDSEATLSSDEPVEADAAEEDPWDAGFSSNELTAEDLDWDPSAIEDEEVDPEIVQLLKAEIEDLRIQLAERDEQLATLEGLDEIPAHDGDSSRNTNAAPDFGSEELVQRVDDLLAELAEHDERVATMQELLQAAEMQNEAQAEERNCLETWVGEIEQRIGERESEWQAEQDALRGRLEDVSEERDRAQQHLHAARQRLGDSDVSDVVPDETLQRLQKMNGELQAELERVLKENASLTRQVTRLETEEPEDIQGLRAELAQEKASVSRIRFQLSKQLQEIDTAEMPSPKDQPDKEFAFKLQTLREHLREIHEEEREEREKKGDSLFGRISSLWKRVDEEY